MEFKLNKVDVEIRQRVKDTTKSGVIHRKESISINKDRNPKDDSKSYDEFKDKLLKYKKNHKITVGTFKDAQYEIEAFKENSENEQGSIGNFIDIKK